MMNMPQKTQIRDAVSRSFASGPTSHGQPGCGSDTNRLHPEAHLLEHGLVDSVAPVKDIGGLLHELSDARPVNFFVLGRRLANGAVGGPVGSSSGAAGIVGWRRQRLGGLVAE